MINLSKNDYENFSLSGNFGYNANTFLSPNNNNQIIKVFNKDNIDIFQRAMKMVSILIKYKEELANYNLAYPLDLVMIDNELLGYSMPFIEGKTFELINLHGTFDEGLDALIKVGYLLEQINDMRKNTSLNDFYLNDIHPGNIIVNNNAYAIDLDSCYFSSFLGGYSLWLLAQEHNLLKIKKYDKECEIGDGIQIMPSRETELYSYAMMILEFMSGIYVYTIDPNRIIDYFNYLEDIGCNKELLQIINNIYDPEIPNENPVYLLESIKEIYNKSHDKNNNNVSRILSYY